jgi:hypothetical protein
MALPREISPEEREDLIARGFKRFELWLPDLRDPILRAQAVAEAERMAFADEEDDVMEWVENAQRGIWDEDAEQ